MSTSATRFKEHRAVVPQRALAALSGRSHLRRASPTNGLLKLVVALRFEVVREADHLWIRRSPIGQTSGWGPRQSIVELPGLGRGLRLSLIPDPSPHGAGSAPLRPERRDIGELFSTLVDLPVAIADETERDSGNGARPAEEQEDGASA